MCPMGFTWEQWEVRPMARAAARIHRSLRIEPEIDAAVLRLQGEDENVTQAYNRVLSAGVEALQPVERDPERDALVEALQSHVDPLRGQLETKDAHIIALTDSLRDAQASIRAAQTLHLAEKQPIGIEPAPQETPQEAPQAVQTQQEAPRGFFARMAWAFKG